MVWRNIGSLIALALSAVVVGCSYSSAGANVADPSPVHGKITLPDKSPLRGGIVYFTPLEVRTGRQLRYEGAGLIDASGQYKIGFNGDDAGVPPGEYKVSVKPRDYQELRGSNSNRIPKQYRESSETPLQVTVKESDNTFDFDLK